MRDLIDKFFATKEKTFFVISGCSLLFTEQLMAFGGSSDSVLGVYCPYSDDLMFEFVRKDYKIVSEENAFAMCNAARTNFGLYEGDIVVSCTAALHKREDERPERVNEAFICISKGCTNKDYHVSLSKYSVSDSSIMRHTQEKVLADRILICLFDFLGIT